MREELNTFIEFALKEDIRDGDHTSLACIPSTAIGKAQLLIKDNGILLSNKYFNNILASLCI